MTETWQHKSIGQARRQNNLIIRALISAGNQPFGREMNREMAEGDTY